MRELYRQSDLQVFARRRRSGLHRPTFAPLRMTAWKYTGIEHTIVEAVLKADPTGYMLKHPWIHSQVDRLLAKWAYKVSTAGGLRLPAFALADDEYMPIVNMVFGSFNLHDDMQGRFLARCRQRGAQRRKHQQCRSELDAPGRQGYGFRVEIELKSEMSDSWRGENAPCA